MLQEGEFADSVGQRVTDIAAHEFFHIVTPLNIHSEIIEHFNFVTPVPSRHLWLYEGTTEWAAHAMQLRSGLKTPEAYLATQIRKMQIDRQAFDSTWSLGELALTSYSDSGQAQYGNIYMRGALTAGLLDIRLLDLSQGRARPPGPHPRVTQKFGKKRAFPRIDAGGHAGGDDPPRGPGLLRPLRLGRREAADQAVLRQARDPLVEDARAAGCGSTSIPIRQRSSASSGRRGSAGTRARGPEATAGPDRPAEMVIFSNLQ